MPKFYLEHCEKYYSKFHIIEEFFSKNPSRVKTLDVFKKLSTVAVYAVYIILLAYLFFTGSGKLLKAIFIPAVIFFVTTAVRSGINAPRPYERYPIKPVLYKATKGKSCPSRHSACAFAIAAACLYVSIPLGIAMLVLSAAIAVSRPVMGVHFPYDVVFGSALALIIALPAFYLIP